MLIANRLFAYPVLSEETGAYKKSVFQVKYEAKRDGLHHIKIEFQITMNNDKMKEMIHNNEAEYVIHAECSATAYRRVEKSSEERISLKLAINDVQTKVECIAMIVAKKDILNFENDDWEDDYKGIRFQLKKGSILAYQNINTLKIMKNIENFKNAESIFSVNCVSGMEDSAPVKVEICCHRIQIQMSKYQNLIYVNRMKNLKTRELVNTLLILPVLVYTLGKIDYNGAEEEYGEFAWYRSLDKTFRLKGTSLQDELENKGVLELAQEIMDNPVFKAMNNMEELLVIKNEE